MCDLIQHSRYDVYVGSGECSRLFDNLVVHAHHAALRIREHLVHGLGTIFLGVVLHCVLVACVNEPIPGVSGTLLSLRLGAQQLFVTVSSLLP